MGALAASVASRVPSGLSLAALASPGEIIRRASRLEEELKELLRVHGGGLAGAEQHGGGRQQTKERFLRAYERLKTELLNDRAFNFDFSEETRQWVAKMLDYNVPGGKLNRGLSVIDSYMLLREGTEVDDEDFYLACVLGWCVEWLQASALVLDDITDNAYTRRDNLCWYKLPTVGLSAINDGVLLKCHVQAIIKRYFKDKFYFLDLLELWSEIGLQTAMGQMLDLITTHTGAKDLARYRIQGYRRIVKYKTSYYSFYLPFKKGLIPFKQVACALLLNDAKLSDYIELKNVLIEMGVYFQIQDDYLDCFGDPEVIGKVGTDIEDYKCSWLIVQAMELANENEMKILYENYGKSDPQCVAAVKNVYKELDLQDIFLEYESRVYKHQVSTIDAEADRAIREILKIFLKKIYRRKK
ncbi:farnesyl pyrophosphate synthase-like isoform X3 [Panicum virgatum]|uniref:farnesyl pyrophosphate synthase-like isoform X3 n=1 Tax=Panicum virgatum TaxID=38727 RepID=UPI0019D539A8|nr:farnesyl pyrophosphate synthase-like isoform X3 [Panicum virgatum]